MLFSRILENIKKNNEISSCEKFVDLFFIFFKCCSWILDIAKVYAKFQRVPFIPYEEFLLESKVHLLSKYRTIFGRQGIHFRERYR